ncbi:MAG TPA: succinate dehydrogenase cytochrome b subunit [Candidatus Hydrogenedentes bacterium]|nr:succinate dehydrogenase cytochrome b subunit [Candidatus Hydrogenedentota bacterium]HPJ99062.1 succinate dehydrogenase cytochrome b subunit [Candidatus Hydrogenedentota bacterium]
MASNLTALVKRSIVKKQIVAVTGIILVTFIFGHLAGNFLIFAGPDALNSYAEKIQGLGAFLWVVRLGLLAAFLTHISLTIWVTLENRIARGRRYEVHNTLGNTTWAKRTMIFTGALVLCYVFIHLNDFTIPEKTGPSTVIPGVNNDESLGLFGLVWNSFLNPLRAGFYILAVSFLGMHLSHGIESVFQSLGTPLGQQRPTLLKISRIIGLLLALSFSSIPIYVIVRHYTIGAGV